MTRLLTSDDLFRIRWLADPQLSPDGRRVAFTVSALDRARDQTTSQIFWCEVSDGESHALSPDGAHDSHARWQPQGRQLAFISQRNGAAQLWLMDVQSGVTRPLTQTLRDVAEPAWSPDGQQLVFVASAPTGRKHLWQLALDNPVTLLLSDGEWDDASPAWSPDGKQIACLSNHTHDAWRMDIWLMTHAGNAPRKLTSGTGPIRAFAWSPDGQHIAYIGHDKGNAQGVNFGVWVVSLTDGTARNLTASLDRSAGLVVRADDVRGMETPSLRWADDGIYFVFAEGGCSHIARVTLNSEINIVISGKRACLSFDWAHNRIAFVAADALTPGEIFIADYRLEREPSTLSLSKRAGASASPHGSTSSPCFFISSKSPSKPVEPDYNSYIERRVTNFNDAWLRNLALSAPEHLAFTASDGQMVEGWLMRPSNFIAGQRYPLILQIHGGPHYPLGERFYFDFQRLAAQGYAILYVNMRGSQGYGETFATQIRGAWGGRDAQDLLETVDGVVKRGEVDETRLAVTGVSYGGYMTNWLIGHTPRFRAALCENGISDLATSFETGAHGEAFWAWELDGTPHTQPERYHALSPITYAEQMRTPLLLIHAERDANCVIQHSELLCAALQRLGREVALVRIPDEGHLMNLIGKPSHRLMRMKAMDAWWARWL